MTRTVETESLDCRVGGFRLGMYDHEYSPGGLLDCRDQGVMSPFGIITFMNHCSDT